MLAAAAISDANGVMSILGAGWQVRPAQAVQSEAVVIVLRIPRSQSSKPHELAIQLFDYDDNPISVDPPNGPGLMSFSAFVEVSGREDLKLRTPLLANYAINLPPFPLEPATQYRWRVHIDGKTRAPWSMSFRTMDAEEEARLGMPDGALG